MSSNLIPYGEMEKMALATAKSGMFGLKSPEQAITLMMIAQSENIHPMTAIMEYDIIGTKPALKATTVLARFQKSGGMIEWIETSDKKAVAKFTHPQGGSITITWTMERAKQADLLKNETWKKFPDQMLRARCIPEGVRAIYPACLSGMYSSDEVRDFTPSEPESKKDDTPFIDAEVEDPKPSLKAEVAILKGKLRNLNLSEGEIKEFATHFDLQNNLDTIISLNGDEAILIEKIKEFEGTNNAD